MKSPSLKFTHPAINLLQKCKNLDTLKQIQAQMIANGLSLHTYPLSILLQASSTFDISYTLSIFNQIENPTIFLYNTVISSLINHSTAHTHIAFSLYFRVVRSCHRVKPNSYTYPSLFKAAATAAAVAVACGSHPWVRYGLALHAHVLKFLAAPTPYNDGYVQASLINYYAKIGKLGVARYLFDQIREPDLATWNSILGAYNAPQCIENDDSLPIETLYLFREMQKSLVVRPNEVTLVCVISACAHLGALSQGVWAHAHVLKADNLRLNRFVGTALVDMYSKCGCLELGRQVFDRLLKRDTLCYNAMIGGFAIHGYGHKALDLYQKMEFEGLVPDNVTFVAVMTACSHVGLVEEGCKIFESIREVHGSLPTVEHYGCVVDLLSRAGRLREAEEKVREMPMKPNAAAWRSLLGAARVCGNSDIGEIALKHLIELEPETSGNYVLLSNMYASIDKWEDVKRVRKLMKDRGIIKMPGSSLIEVGGAVNEFIMGDKTHPLSNEIYLKLEEISTRLREYGHKPSMKEVLFDIEEEEKENALSWHSERLAIAFALMVADSHAPIRIIKNLRVCGDCHTSTKLISLIYGREIIVRDRNRFHHFRDGTCSCLDYW